MGVTYLGLGSAPGHPLSGTPHPLGDSRPPWGSLSASPTRPRARSPRARSPRAAHLGNSTWTLRLPPAEALMSLVDISRWSFLPKKTAQSDTVETTHQRPENCKTAQWPGRTLPAPGPRAQGP